MTKNYRLTIEILCVLGFILFLGFPASATQQNPIKITYSHMWAVGHPVANAIVEWCKEVEKRTNGRVVISVFPSGTLTPPAGIYDGVAKGFSGMGSSSMSFVAKRFPAMEVLDFPLGVKSALTGIRLANAFYKEFQPKELSDTKVMYFQTTGPMFIHTRNTPVQRLEDLKGLRIRSTGTSGKIVAALGGTPVAMPMPETYDGLSKGLVDGTVAPFASLWGYKFGEVVNYTIEAYGPAFINAFFITMNKNVWDSLPTDVKQTIENLNKEWIDKTGKVWDDYDKQGRDFVMKKGNHTVIALPKEEDERWAKAAATTFDDYLIATKEKGLPGEEMIQFCLDFLKNQ